MSSNHKNKFDQADLAELLRRAVFAPAVAACLQGAETPNAALERLATAGFVLEAARLAAHALPKREAVWWACQCAVHTAPPDLAATDLAARVAAEEWVRQPNDAARRQAMTLAQKSGFATPESWAAVAAFWSGDSMSPPDQPAVPPAPHLTGTAVAGAITLAAVRTDPGRRDARLGVFLSSARDIALGGAGKLPAEEAV